MAELNDDTIISVLQDKENCESSFDISLENSPLKSDNRNNLNLEDGSSSDDDGAVKSIRRKVKRFSDSDSEVDKENRGVTPDEPNPNSSESEDDIFPRKSRLVAKDSSDDDNTSPKNESARISDKRSKLHNKFKGLLTSRSKVPESRESPSKSLEDNDGYSSDGSSSGIESIKQKFHQRSMLLKSGICDPDTSDEESGQPQVEKKRKPKQKSTILTSPKPISKPARMSAKQAMENMQKIKSESNRMLREKEVTLPYHRPKALSLKDIMNRRKPALSADGKALPVKMNSEQLKQYVKLLEQRNKEMMELCKSESEEEEETNETKTDDNKDQDCQSITHNEKEETVTSDIKKLDSPSSTYNEEEETTTNDNKELTDNIMRQKDENAVPTANETVGTDEDDLPDLMVEIVGKQQNVVNVDIAEKHEDNDVIMKDASDHNIMEVETNTKLAAEVESQLIELRYETENMQNTEDIDNEQNVEQLTINGSEKLHIANDDNEQKNVPEIDNATISDTDKATNENGKDDSHEFNDGFGDDFSDVDINMEDLESIIENAKNDETAVDSPMLIRDPYNLNNKPKLTGAPGMVIDLDGSNPVGSRKLTGVELLKERFSYFAKLKTPEEKERERELKIKPGMQHLKLKQELEEKISEQRSLEWAKRLEEEKQQQEEIDAIRGDDESDGDDLEKIEAKLQEKEDVINESSSESEEEEEEEQDTCDIKEKPRKKNSMIDDEAEVSNDEESGEHDDELTNDSKSNKNATGDADNEEDDQDSEESSDESSEDEIENKSKPKKGRILKAFEDSDDEITSGEGNLADVDNNEVNNMLKNTPTDSQAVKDSQDDVLPLAQINKSISEDLFGSQTSSVVPSSYLNNREGDTNKNSDEDCADMTTQTFSILNTNTQGKDKHESILSVPTNIDVISETQPVDDANLDDALAMCSGNFTQTANVIPAESQIPESQCAFGEDILEMCTGKFYDNQFVSQAAVPENDESPKENSTVATENPPSKSKEDKDLLDSILQVMEEPVKEEPNKKKYVFDNPTESEAVSFEVVNQVRKKFTIDSDDESNVDASKPAKKNKFKKRKREKQALQISDDEEEEEQLQSDEEAVEYMSEADDDYSVERIVEYDSEENEVEVKPQKQKNSRKMAEFFEQEAEMTSEDEWVGSGDEDERGLDRMEREEGDDDTFHQGQLQQQLGQIHMRDVLDQDKREVRLIQELLFEDGDLGDGHRQRKFRWKNLDGEDETGAVPELFAESQEEEFESEEQWRKQRHEREVFLRNLKENEPEEKNISIDRSSIIKANLCSKTMSSLLLEVNGPRIEETETTVVVDKKTKEEPSRKLTLSVFQQNYHGSLLTRGRGALARLAALAMPLASEADDDSRVGTVGPSSKRNFVFAAVTPPTKQAKASKRKVDEGNGGTPRLIKKFKTDDKQKITKSSLLDHLKAL